MAGTTPRLAVALLLAAAGCVQTAVAPRPNGSAGTGDRDTPPDAAAPRAGAAPCAPDTCARAQDPEPAAAREEKWTIGASVYTYFTDDHDYVQPTFTADRGALHVEARFNYEGLDTGSLWVGRNFAGEEDADVTWSVTPMLGGVFGEVQGIAPGYRADIAWRALALYAEGEYVVDLGDGSNWFYNWSELTVSPVERLRVGVVAQRTRVYDTGRDLQRGLLVGLAIGPLDVTAHVFNPDDDEPVFVVSAALGF
jgi:hypothetical protein